MRANVLNKRWKKVTTGCLILQGFSTGAKLEPVAVLLLVNSASDIGLGPDIVTDDSQDVCLSQLLGVNRWHNIWLWSGV